MARYDLEYKNGRSVVQDSFVTINKAREIARYFITSPKKEIRVTQTIARGGIRTIGYVGLLKDYKTYYWEVRGYRNVLNRNGSVGAEIPYVRG